MQQNVKINRLPGQGRILLLAWLTYTLAYTLRVNIAVVIPVLVREHHFTFAQMGVLTSCYFVAYMLGQLVSGYLGDRLSSKLLIISGLIVSALCNIGMSFMPSLRVLYLLWTINGLAQSMLWAPLMKTLSVWFAGFQLERVSFLMAQSVIVGYAVSWVLSSLLTAYLGWIYAFIVPAVMVLVFVVSLIILFEDAAPDADKRSEINQTIVTQSDQTDRRGQGSGHVVESVSDQTAGAQEHDVSVGAFFRMIQLPLLLVISICHGLIREGISVWFPTILEDAAKISLQNTIMILIIVPLVNFAGIILVKKVNRHLSRDSLKTLLSVFGGMAIITLLLLVLFSSSFWIVILMIVLLLALANGLTPILTSVIPFQFARYRKVALTVGVLDFAIYLGAAVSGVLTGVVADHFDWIGVVSLWLIAAIIGFATAIWQSFGQRGKQRYEQKIHDAE
ncbi:MAG: MFS transporter [Eubacteriales bacterium]|nr:MFS transporter [Eubacteriales bacterium]